LVNLVLDKGTSEISKTASPSIF